MQRCIDLCFGVFRVALIGLLLALPVVSAHAFNSRFSVDLSKYAGLWFEAGRTPNRFQDNTTERDGETYGACFNSQARYDVVAVGEISVRNRCMRRAESGKTVEETITGSAVVNDGSDGRKLQIAFGSGIARFFQRAISGGGFAYWIYCLGPVNAQGVYDWAVVSGPDKDYIFVLSRERTMPEDARAAMLACSRAEGLPVDKLIFRQE